ncbi:MAG: toluene tolerance protein [Betaproteobacteria bacterium]|nr:toluene tolerance protein [Betaproteobacteria bacterium]
MHKLDLQAYQTLRSGAQVIEADKLGDKVLRLADGTFLKLFRRKRLISSAAVFPYAERFAHNAAVLAARGIPCPRVIAVFRVTELKRDGVHYHPLPGITLRELVRGGLSTEQTARLRERFNAFVRGLHDQGLYFRSLHLGNVVLTPDDRLGLIDISDVRVHRKALSPFWRARNLRRMEGIEGERDWLDREILLAPDGARAAPAAPW